MRLKFSVRRLLELYFDMTSRDVPTDVSVSLFAVYVIAWLPPFVPDGEAYHVSISNRLSSESISISLGSALPDAPFCRSVVQPARVQPECVPCVIVSVEIVPSSPL